MDFETSKKQSKKVTIFAIILSVLSLGLLIFGFLLVSSDKVVMLQSISNLYNKVNYLLESGQELSNKISTTDDVGIKSNIKFSMDDMSASLSFDYLENQKDKKSSLSLEAQLNEESLLDANMVLNDNNAYFFLKDITPNYYHTPLEYVESFSDLSSSDYDKIMALLKETITDYIHNEDIKKEKTTIIYNGKEKRVNKLTYTITNKTVKELVTKFIYSIRDDKKLLNNICSYLEKSKEEVIETFDAFLETLAYDEEKPLYYYHIYYYGFNKIIAYDIEEITSKITLEYKIDKKETIRVYQDTKEFFLSEITKKKDFYEFTGFIEIKDVNYPFSGNASDHNLKLIIDFGEMDLQILISSTEQKEQNRYYYKDTIIVSSIIEEEETDLFYLDIDFQIYFNQKVNVNLENSKPILEITEEELDVIQNNILNHPIYEFLGGIIGNTEFSL